VEAATAPRLTSRTVRYPHYFSIARVGAQLATHYAPEWAGDAPLAPLSYMRYQWRESHNNWAFIGASGLPSLQVR